MYSPPRTRKEAVNEIMQSGFTVPAVLAVSLAFPVDGEIAELRTTPIGKLLLEDYGAEACLYLQAWGRNCSSLRKNV